MASQKEMSFAEKLAQRKETSNKLQKSVSVKDKKSFVDPTYWKPELDKKAGKTSYTIRFVEDPFDDTKVPLKEYFDHFFYGPGGVYSELSRKTIGESDDPVYALNNVEYQQNGGSYPVFNKTTKRLKTNYVANIIVLKDPLHPENESKEGELKVFKYKFGAEIFKKIKAASDGVEDIGEDPFNPFDLLTGQDFFLIVNSKNMPSGVSTVTYEASKFNGKSAPITIGKKVVPAELLENMVSKLYDLEKEVLAKVKSVEELQKILDRVLTEKTMIAPKVNHTSRSSVQDDSSEEVDDTSVTSAPWNKTIDGEPPSKKSRWADMQSSLNSEEDED